MKDKLIAQLSEEIDKQAWKFKQDNQNAKTSKSQSDKEKAMAIFNRARTKSQSGGSGPSSAKDLASPKDALLKNQTVSMINQSIKEEQKLKQTARPSVVATNSLITPPALAPKLPPTK